MQKINKHSDIMKPSSITFKTSRQVKKALEKLAKDGFRSLSGQVEMIVIKYLEEHEIDWRKEDPEETKE